ncbi:MAG TPA: hypothetical protein VHC47_03705 [Mucilaginibacter sp.]|nr:hypothetical protein [Mucilaginibacter sp.]
MEGFLFSAGFEVHPYNTTNDNNTEDYKAGYAFALILAHKPG